MFQKQTAEPPQPSGRPAARCCLLGVVVLRLKVPAFQLFESLGFEFQHASRAKCFDGRRGTGAILDMVAKGDARLWLGVRSILNSVLFLCFFCCAGGLSAD